MKHTYFLIAALAFFMSLTIYSQPHTPTPSAIGYGKFLDIPISQLTGTISYSIPIGVVTAGVLSLPISIDYHSGGNKVGDPASCVGLGWNLNTGGYISRTIKGKSDFEENGYWNSPSPNMQWSDGSWDYSDVIEGDGELDGEPDIYTWVAGGQGGKFFIDRNHTIVNITKNSARIEYYFSLGFVQHFYITLDNGVEYIFGFNTLQEGPTSGFEVVGYSLFKVRSYDKKDSIIICYNTFQSTYKVHQLGMPIIYGSNPNALVSSNEANYTLRCKEYFVNRIQGFGNKIDFTSSLREDLDLDDPLYPPLKIDAITYTQQITGEEIPLFSSFQYKLTYEYFKSIANATEPKHKRLKLKQIQKCNFFSPSLYYEPPQIFEYKGDLLSDGSQFFPNYLDMNIDHIGYYNYANNNFGGCNLIQPTAMSANGFNFYIGNANRNPSFNGSSLGLVKKITLPTKGTIQIEYEQNNYYDGPGTTTIFDIHQNCTGNCYGSPSNNTTTTLISNEVKSTGFIVLDGYSPDDCDNANISCSAGVPKSVLLQIFNLNNQVIYSYTLPVDVNNVATIYLNSLSQIVSGNSYTFIISVVKCYGSCRLDYTHPLNIAAPGVRIKQVKISDENDSSKDIIKNYTYNKFLEPDKSSGFIVNKPVYGFKYNDNPSILYFSAFSLRSLHDFDGFYLGYENVMIDLNGVGFEKYIFSKNLSSPVPNFPPKPFQITETGFLEKNEILDNSSNLIMSNDPIYAENNSISDWFHVGHKNQLFWHLLPYNLRINRFIRITSEILYKDGITSNTYYTYNQNTSPPILGPVETSMTNSDGKTTVVKTKYTSQYAVPNSSSIKNELIAKNINIPYETTYEVDNNILDGKRTEFLFFNNNMLKPSYEKRYERTWNNTGALESGSWITNKSYLTYYITNGKLWTYKDAGYEITSLTYDNKMNLTSKSYQTNTITYEYYTNSNLLKKVIEIDGVTKSYDYDELMRLKTLKDDNKLITKFYDYYFSPSGSSNKHKITETITFGGPANNNSNLGTIINISFLDNLGRTIQSVQKGQSPASKDIVTSLEYDKYGRIVKDYLPVEGTTGNGDFLPFQTSWKYLLKTYESSPLSRLLSETPPDWYATSYSYGANTIAQDGNIYDYKNSNNYPENSLRKVIVTDPNGNKAANYIDKKGRTIMTAQFDGTNLASSTNSKKSYKVYDLKDRIESVIVPGATNVNTDLNFYYCYDGKDNVIYKKIPSRGEIYYEYNSKNLLASWRDNNLGSSKCFAFSYDVYGRQLQSGIANIPYSIENPVFFEQHTENIYGTTGIEKGKVKTTKSRVIGTANWLQSTNTFDASGRLQSSAGNNHLNINNTTNALTSNYTYDKGDNITDINLGIISVSGGTNLPVYYTNKYDHIGRNTENLFKYNTGSQTTISKQIFNYRDELIIKYQGKTGLTGINEYLQEINFEYLTNGQLKKINQGQTAGITHYYSCTNPNPTTYSTYNDKDLFYMELYYDQALPGSGGQVRKNGDIAANRWQTKGRSYQNFVYTYDYLDQLKEGKYYDYDHGPNQLINNNRFTESMTYDARGNIATLNRYGVVAPTSCNTVYQFDQLTYNYSGQTGNRISSITDAKTNTAGAQEFKTASGNYSYDANGNITSDPYKGINNILYNHLDKPTQITKSDGSKVTFVYDGNGTMLTKSVYNASGTLLEKRDYIGNFEYVGGILENVMHGEGRYKSVSGSFRHEYTFKDHLGNTRLVYTDVNANGRIDVGSGEILQESHYYPLGLEFKGHYWQQSGFDYRYKFNGIERINDLSLGLDISFFRGHDPITGRWMQVDPDSEMFAGLNPYNSNLNNPVINSDPNGDNPLIAMAVGAAVGVVSNGINNIQNGNNFFQGGFQSAFMGAWSGGVSASIGIGAQFMSDAVSPIGVAGFQAGAHAVTSGVAAVAQGGNFWQGAASGGFSSIVGSGISAFGGGAGAQWIGGGLSGGFGSYIAGGNFWSGVGQGLIVGGLNHAMQHAVSLLFSTLESNYPKYGPSYPGGGISNKEFAVLAGGKVQENIESGDFGNTCALRVCYTLTKSGVKLTYVRGTGNSSSMKGGKWLYPRVEILNNQLSKMYKGITINNIGQLSGKKGIIIFHTGAMYTDATGHASLWNGQKVLGGQHNYLPSLGNGVTATLYKFK